MNIQKIPIGKLNAAKYNPRKDLKTGDAEYQKLKRSIKEFGYVEPIIWNERSGNIVGGHQRFKVLKELGHTEIDCVVLDLDDSREKALNVALNKIGGEFDIPLLTDLLKDLGDDGFDTTLTGFSIDELEKMFSDTDTKEVKDDDFNIDEAAKEPSFVLPGDLWRLGRHRLLCGDSTKAEDVMRLMDGKKANLVLTDPPYMVNYQGKAGTIKNDDLNDKAAYDFLLAAFLQMESVMADDASIYVFYADSKGLIFRRAFDDAGFKLASNCIWVKNNFTFGRSDYKWGHEVCLFGWKKSGKHKWHGDAKQSTVWHCDKPAKNQDHPTVKPLPLLAIPLQNSSSPNSIVLDPFSGSFSTGILCEQTDRVCYGMELDPVYAGVCVKRFREHSPGADITVERGGKILTFEEVIGNG
jgi:DNA modification methylase